ncbi:acyl carrier protein [Vallitalea pronyensis]|uniref:Acyl carrier protein n=1 Tax=Vallitalea pronyensis TaxID=1348613 RepID=A0A8J8SFZ0_9FIRM|nr:phosphopantetheine-binding protein [Vallitalea pronyensis]QUI21837.1 acyl carrier protein [Vallitalea pronyensis]
MKIIDVNGGEKMDKSNRAMLSKLTEICKENLGINDTLIMEKSLASYINNSIDFIKIVVAVETEYNIEFTDDELETDNFETVKDLIEFIQNKL